VNSDYFGFLFYHRRVPHTPGFPVRPGGAGKLRAAFLNESRTRAAGWCQYRKSGYLTLVAEKSFAVPGFSASCLAAEVRLFHITDQQNLRMAPGIYKIGAPSAAYL
jgi:hypothetical protein